jgi:hypothetical protein
MESVNKVLLKHKSFMKVGRPSVPSDFPLDPDVVIQKSFVRELALSERAFRHEWHEVSLYATLWRSLTFGVAGAEPNVARVDPYGVSGCSERRLMSGYFARTTTAIRP